MERDFEYEENNRAYDCQYTEETGGGIKCKNYELCQRVLPPDCFENGVKYLCMACGDWFKMGGFDWNELEFRDAEEDCPVCMNTNNKQVKFPTNCGHWFCVSCTRNILFWDEQRYHLSPVLYGCPHCPNGCGNPERGKQCGCEEYDEIQDNWERSNPDDYNRWNDAENISIGLGEDNPGSVFNSKKCPLCRATYTRK